MARAVVVEEPPAHKAAPNKKPKATNKRSETGTVRFRYFPASALVKIDGQVVSTPGSNRVETRLPVGRHQMVLTHGDQRRTRAFEVKTSQTTNLATITLAP